MTDDRESSENSYAHLIGTPRGRHELATCLYFDHLNADVSADTLLDLAEQWFAGHGFRPRVLLVKDATDQRRPSRSIRTLRQRATGRKAIEVIETLQIFPKGRTTVEDTWRPAVYFAVSSRRPTAVFMSVNLPLQAGEAFELLQQGDAVLGSCAAYAFSFPVRFSPLGYFWGISVQPAGPDVGEWGEQQSRRLSHWRDNTNIGIQGDDGRRWYDAQDGYVRDAYPLMMLSGAHAERVVGAVTLRKAIEHRGIGSIGTAGEKFVWSIPNAQLRDAQALLDDNEVSLSGRRLDWSRKAMQ